MSDQLVMTFAPPRSPAAADPTKAMDRAGRWLALRPRTERELTGRLLEGGFDEDVVRTTIARLKELGLIDDVSFARQWVEERAARKGVGPRVLTHELVEKGIDRELAEAAVADVGPDEADNARRVAATQLKKLIELPVPDQAARLLGFLARRGFSQDAAEDAVRAVLPPEGWD